MYRSHEVVRGLTQDLKVCKFRVRALDTSVFNVLILEKSELSALQAKAKAFELHGFAFLLFAL